MGITWEKFFDISRVCGRHAGDIGEKIAYMILTQKGYELWSFSAVAEMLFYESKEHKDKVYDVADEFFNHKYTDNFIRFCSAWNKEPDATSRIRLNSLSLRQSILEHRPDAEQNNTFYLPTSGFDWVGKKNDRFYFIEVKTNKAVLRKFQKKMMLKARDFGFIPLLVTVNVEIKVPLDEVEIKEL